uniref:Ribonuclease E n=1 Tax=Liagoropsis maxima TaxID=1653392 RepID=A0A1G4NVZ2_9FLOR|nr:Ribonuclease E [Liagoropsis maxima]SCW22686.1 Ribonuclease E [Liagoropsis maxima]
MIKKIIISQLNNIAAIIQNSKIQELIVINNTYQVNDIYIGIVQKIFTSINAAFIKLSYHDKSGFIHISDAKYTNTRINRNFNSVTDVLTLRQKVLVQIIKEPTQSKGPRLTTNIHLSGQHLVLMPFNNTICIGQKIYDENERSFLRALGILIKPINMGILFKESASGIEERRLIEDIRKLNRQWHFIEKSTIQTFCPSLLYQNTDIIQKILRDHIDHETDLIVTDSKYSLQQLHEHFEFRKHRIHQNTPRLKLYQDNACILEKFKVNSVIFKVLNSKVELPSGIYMFIETSEALTIIDVNSGSFNQSKSSCDALLRTNCLAASEIAYQLKMRNINGIIIIDFIDMQSYKDQIKLLEHLNKVFKNDEAKPEIIQMSELGLVELTRRRRGQSLTEIFASPVGTIHNKHNTQRIHSSTYNNTTINKNYILDINSIFFKKKFAKSLLIKNYSKIDIGIKFIPLKYRYIMPLNLYYSTIDHQFSIL